MNDHKPIFFILPFLFGVFINPATGFVLESERSCDLPYMRSATIRKVHDDGILQLQSGQLVRLIGVLPVKFFDNASSPISRKLNKLAKQAVDLVRMQVEGKKVELHQGGRRHDRYDRLLAHVFGPDKKWLQGQLLRAGLARSYSYLDNHICMQEMLELEALARQERRPLALSFIPTG